MAIPNPPACPAYWWLPTCLAEATVNGKSRCGEICVLKGTKAAGVDPAALDFA
jgi:hypothetical protein